METSRKIPFRKPLQVAREDAAEQLHRPALQRLRKQRVVRVAEDRLADGPGPVPGEAVHVQEEAHQLGDGDGRHCGGVVSDGRGGGTVGLFGGLKANHRVEGSFAFGQRTVGQAAI